MKAGNALKFSKTIVAAMDTGDIGSTVFKQTLVMAFSARARVVLVGVTPHYEGNMNRMCLSDAESQLSEPYRKVLADAKEYGASLGLELETVHRTGKLAEELIKVARERGAGLVVLGSERRSQVERMLLGRSLTEIVQHCGCDVLMIPEGCEVGFARVLVGVNEKVESLAALRRGFDVQRNYGGELHAVHVITIPPDKMLRYGVQAEADERGQKVLRKVEELAEERGLAVRMSLAWETPERGLVEYARQHDMQLIILGARARSGMLEGILDSIAEAVAARAFCPVLISMEQQLGEQAPVASLFGAAD